MMTQSAYNVVGVTAGLTVVGIVVIAVLAPASVAVITTLVGFVSVVVLQIMQLTHNEKTREEAKEAQAIQLAETKKVSGDMGLLEKSMNSKMDKHIEEIRAAATAKGVLEGRRQVEDETKTPPV